MNKEKKIYVVGIGPGSYEGMTGKAVTALESSDVIVGYTVYVELVKDHFPGKSFLTTPMRKEVDRCVLAEGTDCLHDLQWRCRSLRNGRADV